MSRSKNSWKLLVIIALVSSIVFCSEVCAVQKEEIKAIKAEQKCERKEVKAEQKEEKKAVKEQKGK
jgi:hypothetical protein